MIIVVRRKNLFYITRRNVFDKLVNILFEFRGCSQRKVSEKIRILSGRISGKLPWKPGEIREKISDDLVWTLTVNFLEIQLYVYWVANLLNWGYIIQNGILEKWDPQPGMSTSGTRDPKMSRWDLGPGTPEYSNGTQDH